MEMWGACSAKEGVRIMRVQNNTILMFLNIMFVLVLIITPTEAHPGACVHQPDAPDCPCFDNWGEWHPMGAFIQDVAIQTVWTRASCVRSGGKPYYQMVVGCNSEECAMWVSSCLTHGGPIFDVREAWCSETVAYWHRETGIPYPGGYRRNWHLDWQKHGIGALMRWYQTEEWLAQDGRGSWIDPCDVDYENFILGVTVPVPGAYIPYQNYDNGTWIDGTHSVIINEMIVHEDVAGTIFRVEVRLLEGNNEDHEVVNTRRWDDILSITPQGLDLIEGKAKIKGFGIDLDSTGQPIYDPARLHWIHYPGFYEPPGITHVEPNDPVWEHYYAPQISKLVTYAQMLLTTGGPNVTCSSPLLQISGIPDGMSIQWNFPSGLTGPIEIDIDLMDVHPLPIRGIELTWDGSSFPPDYRVQYAASTPPQYQEAFVPDLNDVPLPSPPVPIPVPAIFATTGSGVEVRYVKLIFPSTFQQDATLQELRFRYDQGPWTDTDLCQVVGDLDGDCRVGFSDFARMAANWLVDCVVNPEDPACVPE